MSGSQYVSERNDNQRALQDAYQAAIGFPLKRASALSITQAAATELAEQEAVFLTVAIDEHGMSGGMRLNLLQPVHQVA